MTADRRRAHEARLRGLGLTRISIWVRPEDAERVKAAHDEARKAPRTAPPGPRPQDSPDAVDPRRNSS